MPAWFLRIVALALAVVVLVMFSMTTGGAVAHEIEHAHHTAALHGTGICAWMCAAGSVVDGAAAVLSGVLIPICHVVLSGLIEPDSTFPLRVSSRAPPSRR